MKLWNPQSKDPKSKSNSVQKDGVPSIGMLPLGKRRSSSMFPNKCWETKKGKASKSMRYISSCFFFRNYMPEL